MKIPSRTARWAVLPAPDGVTLSIEGVEHRISIHEADKLSELLDETALYARAKSATTHQ